VEVEYGTERQFRDAVEAVTGPVPDDTWERLNKGGHTPYEVEDFQELVDRIRGDREKLRGAARRLGGKSTPGAERAGRVRLFLDTDKETQDDVREFRRHCFGSLAPPFADREKAEEWIREEAETERASGREPVRLPQRVEWVGKESRRWKPTRQGGNLERLRVLSAGVGSRCGCSAAEATNFVLIGEHPGGSALAVAITASSDPVRACFSVTVRSPDVHKKDLLRMFGYLIEQIWGTRRATPASGRELDLVQFARSRRGGSLQQLHREWNSRYPEHAFESQEAFRKARERALRRFENATLASRGALVSFLDSEDDDPDEPDNVHAD
jgi:hypothetical protein